MTEPRESFSIESLPLLYTELAPWFHLLTAPEDYAEEAEFYRKIFMAAFETPPRTLLEIGSGGGNNASHLKEHFSITLVDLSASMLAISRQLNPECEHIQGDMRNLRLGRRFDVVFIHDAITYLTTEVDLASTIETAYIHCRSGGIALLCPDHVRETFRPSTKHGGHDGDRRGLRYVEWYWDPDTTDTTYVGDFAYLLREGDSVRCVYDRHVLGMFARHTWLTLMSRAGFQVRSVPFEHSEIEPGTSEVFLGIKPNS
jgi:SAM-dependent methyltransferase